MIIKRVVKYVAIFIAVITTLTICVAGVAVGFILTPETLTPQIVAIAQQHTRSKVSIKSVDLSIFNNFPNISLRIDSLRIAQTNDSISDLLFAKQCRIAIDPVELFKNRNIMVRHATLRGTNIYLYVDSLSGPLKTFILPEESDEQLSDTLNSMGFSDYRLTLKRIKIDSAQIVVDDRTKQFYTRVDNYGLDMSLDLSSSITDLNVATGFDNLIVWHKGDLLVKKTAMELRTNMHLDMDSLSLKFDRARIKLNGIDLRASGELRGDRERKGVVVDVRSSLNTPSLTEFLALIPPTIIDNKDSITTQGSVVFDIDVEGLYSDDSMPTIAATLKVDNAKAKYESRRLSLENVNCDAFVYVDLNQPKTSYADIRSFNINTSEIIDLNFSGKITDIIEDPEADLTIRSNIDLNRFSELFPLNDGLICRGTNESNIKTQFNVEDLQNSNYSKLYVDGESIFSDFEVSFDSSKFVQDSSALAYLYVEAKSGVLTFGESIRGGASANSRTLRANIALSQLGYKTKSGEYLSINDVELRGGANFDHNTSEINGFGLRGIATNSELGVDTLYRATLASSDVTIVITPKKEDRAAKVQAKVNSQYITASESSFNSAIELSAVDMNVALEHNVTLEQPWSMDGTVAFSDLYMQTDLFPLDLTIHETSVSVGGQRIQLDGARLTIGESEFIATGYISNLMKKLFVEPRVEVSGELSIQAPLLNVGELIEASNSGVLMIESLYDEGEEENSEDESGVVVVATVVAVAEEAKVSEPEVLADSTRSSRPNGRGGGVEEGVQQDNSAMILVPRRIDFVFDLNIDKAIMDSSVIENIVGRATLKDGVLSLDKLSLKAIGAEATGSLAYRNIDRASSNLAANLTLSDVDINRIGELIPSVDTMFPMLQSFEGIVNFSMKVNTNIDGDSMVDISTLNSAMEIKGTDLVLMDSETFASLSKTMMFKNKDRNVIDSLEVLILVDESRVDVLPFPISIDRYSAIIGGSQSINPETFDVNYDYNISIMKSPLPFKAGVNVAGDLEDFKFKVTKATLKKTDFDTVRGIYDEYHKSIDESVEALESEIAAKREEARTRRAALREDLEREIEQSEQQADDVDESELVELTDEQIEEHLKVSEE